MVGALAFGLALLPLAASASVDLKSLLVAPPTSDWVEADATPTILEGPFTAESYAAWLQAVGSNTATQAADNIDTLRRYGFATGYARSWEQRGTQDLLEEHVFEFADSQGAGYWYADIKLGNQTGTYYAGDLPVSAIPDSFGVVLKAKTGTDRLFRVAFKKGNLMFDYTVDTLTADDTALVMGQATKSYGLLTGSSPSPTSEPVAATPAAARLPQLVTGGIIAGIVAVISAGLIGGLYFVLSRRGRRPAHAVVGAVQMSPDWSYWWDGALWQPTATTTPPSAPRSPDGAYWWDGASWRPVAGPPG